MPRKPRLIEPGVYHVINRGVERRDIYLEFEDYEYFLDLLSKVSKDFNLIVHTFCLMTNHYHILLETKEENISKALQYLNDKYARYFNKKYTRTGHLWQGRFKSFYLYDDAHFWIVAKYIERNPIKANLVDAMSTYRFQSYSQWKYKSSHYDLLKNSMIFDMTLKEYEEYISTDLQVDAMDVVYDSPKIKVDGEKIRLLTKRLETFFEYDRDINRNENIKKAYEYGYNKSEIAKFFNLNQSSISRIINK